MISTIKQLFGLGPKVNYKELVKNGAKILDVRSRAEYSSGHIKGSVNVPLNELNRLPKSIKPGDTIITCCASGMRSAAAKSQLRTMGFSAVHNGGGWFSLNQKLR
ncbi:MAG TPA: rhodanese-like domain-containing protein [Bacteroidia bacterium]|nr:rhodanese-like domain-containing protein [Bacteroidia bacterium]